jgi:hypothetical protein
LAKRYVTLRKLSGVEWIDHAVTCAKPNLKLRRVLERRGFVVKNVEGVGEADYLVSRLRARSLGDTLSKQRNTTATGRVSVKTQAV